MSNAAEQILHAIPIGREVTLKQDTTATDSSIIPAGTRVTIVDNHKNRRTTISLLEASESSLDDILYQFKATIGEVVEIWLPGAYHTIEPKKFRSDPTLGEGTSDETNIRYISEAMRCTIKDPKTGLLSHYDLKRGNKIRLTSEIISPQNGGRYRFQPALLERQQVTKYGRHRLGHDAFSPL